MSSLLRGTGYFKAEYIYERSSDNDLPFDCEAFQANSEEMNLATTRADTGESIYITRDDIHEQADMNMYVRALDVAVVTIIIPLATLAIMRGRSH